jgi:hypothetical protein
LDEWPFDMEPLDIESWDIAWVDDILSWSLCACAPEVIEPLEFDPLDMASVLCPLDIEPELEDCASAKLETPAPMIKTQAIVLA